MAVFCFFVAGYTTGNGLIDPEYPGVADSEGSKYILLKKGFIGRSTEFFNQQSQQTVPGIAVYRNRQRSLCESHAKS